ncbi:hypothetical protein G7059_07885 [Erysipelothrix sp. HDW6A]|uniref:hypothetical protein n=1 Tax=Erysipelothrix sp. HDW6A TaxID=2714928 RepID=UPI00140BC4DD|nr:hypothetical protein [Erysipelothrix sp. HDW6A]QIK57763.1 hypothetical protein G7059_07885 [Erysipelothrix sp. HDW6A]
MYQTNEEFIKLSNAITRRPIPIVFINDIEIDIISIDFKEPRDSFVGGFVSKYVTLCIDHLAYEGTLVNALIEPYIMFKGSDIKVPIGRFYVDNEDIVFDEVMKKYTITAYDSTVNFDIKYEPIDLPATGASIITQICNRLKIPVNVPSLNALVLSNDEFTELNIGENERISYRQVVNDFARLNLSNAKINRFGVLEFVCVFSSESVSQISGHDYMGLKIDKTNKPINSLVYNEGDVEDPIFKRNELSIEEYGLTELKLPTSIFIQLNFREYKREVVDRLFNLMVSTNPEGFIYHEFSTDQVMRPDFDSSDVVEIMDMEEKPYKTVLTNVEWSWKNGGLRGSLSCPLLPETLTDYELDSLNQSILNMGIKVDRIAVKITEQVEVIEKIDNELLNQSSIITQTQSSIEQEIIDRISMGETIIEETTSLISSTSESWQIIFTKIENEQQLTSEELNQFKTYFRWDINGAIIGKEGSPIELYQTNNRIEFRENGVAFAYWEGGTMSVDNIIAKISIIIGTHLVETYQSPVVGKSTIVRQVD